MELEALIQALGAAPECADFMAKHGFAEFEKTFQPPAGLTDAAILDRLALLNLALDAAPLLKAAKVARESEALSHLFGYLAYYWWQRKECEIYGYKLPKFTGICGEEVGALLDLALALEGIEPIRAKFALLGIPDAYALAALERIQGSVGDYRRFHNGKIGYPESQHHWMRHFVNGELFRIGRLEYMLEIPPLQLCAAMFRHKTGGKIIGLCREGWKLTPDGFRLRRGAAETPDVVTAHLIENEQEFAGIPVNPAGFAEVDRAVHLPRAEYEEAWTQDDLVPDVHIPSGGGMTPEKCLASFTEAVRFFKTCFQRDVKAFTGVSWIFNPDLCEVLPESNLAKLMREVYLSPYPSGDDDGLDFVFGKSAGDWSDFPRETSIQRAFHELRERGKKLKEGGMALEAHALAHYGESIYRKEFAAPQNS